jgi:hypothetical protein
MAVNVVSGQYQQVLTGRLLKFGAVVDQALVYVVANKVGQVDQVLMVDELLQLLRQKHLQYVRQDQLAVTQDVILVEDFRVTYADQADFVCVHRAVQKQQVNVFGVKDVLTQDVKCSTVVV